MCNLILWSSNFPCYLLHMSKIYKVPTIYDMKGFVYLSSLELTCKPHLPKDRLLPGMLGDIVHVRQQDVCFHICK